MSRKKQEKVMIPSNRVTYVVHFKEGGTLETTNPMLGEAYKSKSKKVNTNVLKVEEK